MKGFDTERYLKSQIRTILERVNKFKGKLYLEFGGKLFYDYHAQRVLPGYDPNLKIRLLKKIKDRIEIIFCVSAKDIQSGKIRGDFNLSYDNITIKTINDIRNFGLPCPCVVITRFSGEKKAIKLKEHLEKLNILVYIHKELKDYPENIDLIVSENGYGSNPYIKTQKPIVVVTGAGPGSGKMSTALSQIYNDRKRNIISGFAKWETFPIWNLPLKHPVNIAYEAATADIGDYNMVDPFHLSAYGIIATNYNRDVENFKIVKAIIDRITDSNNPMKSYMSPTDMGVNMAKEGIINYSVVKESAKQEIIRRYFRYNKEYILGICEKHVIDRMEKIMKRAKVKPTDRTVVTYARQAEQEAKKSKDKGHKGIYVGAAIQLKNGRVIKGKNSPLLHAESAVILNTLKKLSNIPDSIDLLPPNIIKQITDLKENMLGEVSPSLDVEETLIALSISASMNPMAEKCIKILNQLKGLEMHVTYMPKQGDESGLRKIGINCTTDGKMTFEHYI